MLNFICCTPASSLSLGIRAGVLPWLAKVLLVASDKHDPDEQRDGQNAAASRFGDPERIGPYRLLEVLGEGGMGVVYMAEQTAPVQRRVALKIIKLGMDTKEVVSRFESERQALAVMDHPNIARVLDGGATETGRPYFAMELVRGVPITEYADTHKLTTEERLRLFLDVCSAVQHAHQKGVIHRDLKPSNVLVSAHESQPLVKVIDFGIAKAIGRPLTDRTLVTQLGQMVGTPEYMSPEQAEMSGLDVDTRTDVYSLGVTLYELMVGALPFELATRPEIAIPYTLRERETPRPSARFTSLGPQGAVVAERRRTNAASLRHELKGDLDWIILKAMDKDRTRRYDTAHGLALDLQRHLANEPVLARPPSTRYRMSKFVQRHRAGVAASAIAIAAILLGAGAATTGFVRARRAQAAAVREAATAKQTSDFLVNLFKVNDPGEARGNTVTAREILDQGAVQIDTQLAGQPMVQSRMMRTIGRVYTQLGLYDRARPLLVRSVELERGAGTDDELAQSLEQLGDLDQTQGRFADAERELNEALDLRKQLYGDTDPRVAGGMDALGKVYVRNGQYDEAEPLLLGALDVLKRAAVPDSIQIASVLNDLGAMYLYERQLDRAQPYLEEALGIRRRTLPPLDPELAKSWNNLGTLYYRQKRYAEAVRPYREAQAIFEKVLAPDHLLVGQILNNLAEIYWRQKRYDDAERDFLRALAIKRKQLQPGDPGLAVTMNGLANVYRDEGRFAKAEPLYRQALEIREKVYGSNNADVRESLTDYAELLTRMGQDSVAAALRRRAAVGAAATNAHSSQRHDGAAGGHP
jgi:serine/threonine protein kinase/tetratricopeptide (TPR) repeat protein